MLRTTRVLHLRHGLDEQTPDMPRSGPENKLFEISGHLKTLYEPHLWRQYSLREDCASVILGTSPSAI